MRLHNQKGHCLCPTFWRKIYDETKIKLETVAIPTKIDCVPRISKMVQATYLRPMVRRCWPMRRTMSWLVLSISLGELVLPLPFEALSPLVMLPGPPEPFWRPLLEGSTAPFEVDETPFSSTVPFAACCIVASSRVRCFLRGGGASPPSSDSPLEARLAKASPWWNFGERAAFSVEILFDCQLFHHLFSHPTLLRLRRSSWPICL